MKKLLANIQEAYNELRYKVSWPSKKTLVKSAIIVMIASVVIALIIFIMDRIVNSLMHLIYSLQNVL
ncbi:MAG: preprotein translocase subunit SecE [Muribaculaceae bacterium]|nr:preprotein translocase subunit SecE [Muribaculaceae bacterium]